MILFYQLKGSINDNFVNFHLRLTLLNSNIEQI
jgi:hypothetical protein